MFLSSLKEKKCYGSMMNSSTTTKISKLMLLPVALSRNRHLTQPDSQSKQNQTHLKGK